MGISLSSHFLLFLWFSGVNHLVNPTSETGSGMESEDYQQEDMVPMEDQYNFNLPQRYRLALPPYHSDPVQAPLKRQYRLEDFLWTGSGDGPHPSEQDGGLAWEDNGGGGGSSQGGNGDSRSWIKVTRTMTLYRTVLTTIYPVEMTPTVISGHVAAPVQPTPHLSDFFSESHHQSLQSKAISSSESVLTGPTDSQMWLPTPTFTGKPPEPTQFISPSPSSSPSTSPRENDVETTTSSSVHQPEENRHSAASTDLMYWIQTSIKANDTAFKEAPRVFQSTMQKKLARVYASAFKRHLMSNLGVLQPLSPTKNSNRKRRRVRRNNDNSHRFDDDEIEYYPDQLHRWLYVAQSSMSPTQLKHLATAAMNVTVTILNISAEKEPEPPRVNLHYIVLAEGTPVPAASAVKELDLVTKEEMEHEIGYEIINKKAEALVAGPPEQMTRNEQVAATSPWLIVAVTTICLLVILLGLIAFMVWKWKHNRLGDSNARRVPPAPRPQSGIIEIEEGVINPAFLGTPSRIGRGESPEKSPKSSPAISLLSARARSARKKLSAVLALQSSRSGQKERSKKRKETDEEDHDGEERGMKGKRKHKGEISPTSSEELRLHKRKALQQPQPPSTTTITSSEGSAEWKELLGERKTKGSRIRQRSPARNKSAGLSAASGGKGGGAAGKELKDVVRKKRKKVSKIEEASLRTDEEEDLSEEMLSPSSGETEGPDSPSTSVGASQPVWSRGGTDAISLGNLDICQDSIAQTPSEYARKLVPWKRPGSAVVVAGGSKSGSQYHHYQSGSSVGRPSSRLALPETIEEVPSYNLTEEEDGEGCRELDRDLSERSSDMDKGTSTRKSSGRKSTSPLAPDKKDAKVQTPTRISKTTSHKTRAAPKPRKSWRGGGGPQSESVISTESEEVVEVHHINSSMSDDQNPLGRMRKRFHQFLDDAFNVMVSGTKKEDSDNRAETQSAKVSISHEVVEKETNSRPWTSHVIREESLQKLRRPKSAAMPIGPPKRAWTASSERKTHSAKSKASSTEPQKSGAASRFPSTTDVPARFQQIEDDDEDEEVFDKMSRPFTTVNRGAAGGEMSVSDRSQSHSSMVLSPAFIFPQYPAYPDIRVETGSRASTSTNVSGSLEQPSQSQQPPPPSLPIDDPAVPVIQAIKHEIKRFEKESPSQPSSKKS